MEGGGGVRAATRGAFGLRISDTDVGMAMGQEGGVSLSLIWTRRTERRTKLTWTTWGELGGPIRRVLQMDVNTSTEFTWGVLVHTELRRNTLLVVNTDEPKH